MLRLHLNIQSHTQASYFRPLVQRHFYGHIGKLVRDKIPNIIEKSGKKAEITVIKKQDYQFALQKKLYEELVELNNAETNEEWLEELADIQEVVLNLLRVKGYEFKDLENKRMEKKEHKGGFEQGFYLIRTFEKKE